MNWILFLLTWLVCVNTTNAQTFTIGTAPANPPFSFQADKFNHFYGFEIEIMSTICKRLQDTCKYKPIVASKIVDALERGEIDFAVAAIIFPDSPLNGFVFSLPYLKSGAQFMTLINSPINNLADIKGTTVGVRRGSLGGGTIFKDLILNRYDNDLTVKDYATIDDVFLALSNGDVDVIFTNELATKYWYYNHKTLYKLVGNPIPVGDGYSIMATDKYDQKIKVFNNVLLDMMSDGTYLKIYNSYFSGLMY